MKLLRQITDKDILGEDKLSKADPRYTARAILMDHTGKIAVMYAKKHLLHSLPGGGIEGDEDKLTAVKREILEETGCECEIIRELGYVYENRAHSDFTQYSYYYIAKVVGPKGKANLTESELNNGTAVEWHDLNEAIALITTPIHKTLQQQFIQCKDIAALNEFVAVSKQMSECVFCKIINRASESKVIYETESILAILDIDPINEGHILILPKIHVDSIEKVPLAVLNEMLVLAQKIVPIYQKIYGVKGYSIMQNGGEFCDFGHFHLHLFPRYSADGFGWNYPEGVFEATEAVADKIKSILDI